MTKSDIIACSEADNAAAKSFLASWPKHGFADYLAPALAEAMRDHRLQSIAALGAENWQPIETAPRDGDVILVFCPRVGVTEAQYEHQAVEPFWNYDVWDIKFQEEHRCDPTHWRPLPSPPTTGDEKP